MLDLSRLSSCWELNSSKEIDLQEVKKIFEPGGI